jgi:hypothetical protein
MVARISAWWDKLQFWEHVRAAVRRSRWAMRSAIRLRIARDVFVETTVGETKVMGLPTNLTPDAALAAVLRRGAIARHRVRLHRSRYAAAGRRVLLLHG